MMDGQSKVIVQESPFLFQVAFAKEEQMQSKNSMVVYQDFGEDCEEGEI